MYYERFIRLFEPILQKNKIAVFLSGGFDSAISAYCMLKIVREYSLPATFSFYNFSGSIIQSKQGLKVKEYLETHFGSLEYHYIDSLQENYTVRDILNMQTQMTMDLIKDNNIDIVVRFDNKVPAHLQSLSSAPIRKNWIHPKFSLPLIDVLKDEIVGLALELNLHDLITITKSCLLEQEIRCGECYQCRERAWAFEQNNTVDPGSM